MNRITFEELKMIVDYGDAYFIDDERRAARRPARPPRASGGARLVAYSAAVVCPECGRRVAMKHSALFVAAAPDYDAAVRAGAVRRWNAALEKETSR